MKSNKIALVLAFLLPIVAMASGTEHHEVSMSNSDFYYRVLNFAIFAGLVYYLVANPIRDFFKGRSADIQNQLNEIKAKLEDSKNEAKLAQENLVKAEERAKEIVEDAKVEAKILVENIAKKNDEAIASLEKHLEEKMEVEKSKMVKTTIKELLESGIDSSDIAIDNSKVVSLISKKVA
jgi:F-type H+-transporting ATPase subunit b